MRGESRLDMLEFDEKSIKVIVDTSKCVECTSKACVDACKKYARGILSIDENGMVSTGTLSKEEVLRLGTECLACEFSCRLYGKGAIEIEVPIQGLDDYLRNRGLN